MLELSDEDFKVVITKTIQQLGTHLKQKDWEPQQNKNRDQDYQMKSLELKNTITITQTQ